MTGIRYLHHPTTLFKKTVISLLIVLFLIVLSLASLQLVKRIGLPEEIFLVVPIVIMMVILIFIQPKLGILLIAVLSPLDLLQRIPGTSLNAAKIVGFFTLVGIAIPLLTKRYKLERTRLDKPMLLFLCLYIISLWKISNLEGINRIITTISYMFLYLLLVNLVKTWRFFLSLIVVLCTIVFLLSCLAIAQFITGKVIVPTNFWGDAMQYSYLTEGIINISGVTGTPRAIMTSVNPNSGAGFLVLILPIVLAFIFIIPYKISRLLLLFVVITILFGITVTQSRSALLGLIAAILCVAVFYKVRVIPLLLALFLAIILFIGIYYLMPEYKILMKLI